MIPNEAALAAHLNQGVAAGPGVGDPERIAAEAQRRGECLSDGDRYRRPG